MGLFGAGSFVSRYGTPMTGTLWPPAGGTPWVNTSGTLWPHMVAHFGRTWVVHSRAALDNIYVELLSLNFQDSTAVWEMLDRWARSTAKIGCPPSIRRWIVHTAQQILSGSLDVFQGVIELDRLEMTNEYVQGDPDLLQADYISAIGDDLSAGANPSLLHPDRLQKVEEFKKWATGAIHPHLLNLIERYGSLPDCDPLT